MSLNTTIQAFESVIGNGNFPPGVDDRDLGEPIAPELDMDADWEASWLQSHIYEVQEVMGEPTRERRSVALEALMERMATKWREKCEL